MKQLGEKLVSSRRSIFLSYNNNKTAQTHRWKSVGGKNGMGYSK